MSIRVSQPAINLREKLTETGTPPIGAHGSQLMNSSSVKESFDLVKAGRKNMVINGDFKISQRATSVANLSSGWNFSTVDRWRIALQGGGTWTSSQDTDVPIGQGFTKSWKLDCSSADTAIDSTDYFILEQRIESNRMAELCWGTKKAKPVALSFWVKSSVVGDCNAMLHGDNFNTTRIVNQNFTIHNANEWEYKTMTFPAHGPENAWTTDNTCGVRLWLWFKAGANWTAGAGTRNYWRNNADNQQAPGTTINIASSASNNLWITGVQLEAGYNATPFEYRSWGEELELCERYYEVHYQNTNTNNPAGSHNDGYNAIAAGGISGSKAYFPFKYRTQKCKSPTISYGGKFRISGAGSGNNKEPDEFYSPSIDGCRLRFPQSGGSTGGGCWVEFDGGNSTTGFIAISAEI